MFEITPEDITALNDTDLRTLVHRLAELELKSHGFSAAHVMAGGAQDAPDEGVDVHVNLPSGVEINGFIPRTITAFQVKNMDMPPAKIRKEMRPTTVSVRPVIQELANQGGAYIIATSGSVTYGMQKARLTAMKEAVEDIINGDALRLDYYDRSRLATWVRDHPALVPWIREKIGKAIPGWRPYGAWAYPAEATDAEYLIDEGFRIGTGKKEDGEGLSVLKGIEHIRTILRMPGKIVRLVGLSGVGKTRFVQALFDSHVGEHNLEPALAIYTNTSHEPNPQPCSLATDLVLAAGRAILVIDNCTRELHHSVSEVCRAPGSQLSLITVEHDLCDDVPEGTDVFRLQPSSVNLIEKLLANRFPTISSVSVRTIAENSDGNARIAIVLAGTVGTNETVSTLADEELFRRLFQQGHHHDESLTLAAQAMSLVYSFQGKNISHNQDAELFRLGAIAGKSAEDMYRYTAQLHERDLVQHRGVWRALLPHALANRLAKNALKSIPHEVIEGHLVRGAPARLVKSFSRRLGYLSDSAEAVSIANNWLAQNGMLGDIASVNELEKAMFMYVAPVAPAAAVSALERALLGPDGDAAVAACRHLTRLVRLLAYDATMFERCARLLLKIAAPEDVEEKSNEAARNVFLSLFTLYLSGTHATVKQRLDVIKPLLLSQDARPRSLGLKALGGLLETTHFSADYGFEFGSRVRDYGYWPRTVDEVRHWFGTVLQFAAHLACSDNSLAECVRRVIAEKFRGLWTSARVYDELEETCRAITSKHFWHDGWLSVRETQSCDSISFQPEVSARLCSLEQTLRPKDLVQNVLAIVLGNESYSYDIVKVEGEDEEQHSGTDALRRRVEATDAAVRSLGQAVARETGVFAQLIGALLTGRGHLRIFGLGLAQGSQDLQVTWNCLRDHAAATSEEKMNLEVVCGFLAGVHGLNPELADKFLEDAVEDEALGFWYPVLEASFDIDTRGGTRLMRALSVGKAPVYMYRSMISGRVMMTIPPEAMKELVLEIASKLDGFPVATEILHMSLFGRKEIPPELLQAGWSLLEMIPFTAKDQHQDFALAKIAEACLKGDEGADRVVELCSRLKKALSEHQTHVVYYGTFLSALLNVQPKAALDTICGGNDIELHQGLRLIQGTSRTKKQLFGAIPQSDLLAWCDEKPASRYPAVADEVVIFSNDDEAVEREWSPTALRLLDKAPDRVEVLKGFVRQIKSPSGWGAPAAIVEVNAKLLNKLEQYPDPAVTAFVAEEKVRLAQYVAREKQSELAREREKSDRFE